MTTKIILIALALLMACMNTYFMFKTDAIGSTALFMCALFWCYKAAQVITEKD